MSKIERFEDIQAWQRARELSKEIYKVTNDEPFTKDYSLKDQIRKASTSIMLNIAKGFARRSTNEFKQFSIYCSWLCRRSSIYPLYCFRSELICARLRD